MHGLRGAARAEYERLFGPIVREQLVQRSAQALDVRIVSDQPSAVAPHTVDRTDALRLGRKGVEQGQDAPFIGNRNVESAQVGDLVRQTAQLADLPQREKVVTAAGYPFALEFGGEVAGRSRVDERTADQPEASHAHFLRTAFAASSMA